MWISIVLLFIKIIFYINQESLCFQITFIAFQTNVLYLTVYLTIMILDFYSLIIYFTKSINQVLYFLILFAFPFVAYIPLYFFSSQNHKNIKNNLSLEYYNQYETVESFQRLIQQNERILQDDKKCQYFSKLGIGKSFNQAVKYLAVGISEQSDLFLDMSLIKFIADQYHTITCYTLVTQLLSYFPHESRLLNFFFLHLTSFPNLGFEQRFLIFQIDQVKTLRESSSSSELTLKLSEMKTLVKRGISHSRRFWNNPNVQLSYFYQMKAYTDHVKALYDELVTKYPNNVRLYYDYSYFLIECATDFTNGIKMK
jgi:hypothetical protein